MTESEAVEKLKNMRLFMQIEDENNDCKFTEDDYKANEMAIQALEKLKDYEDLEKQGRLIKLPCKIGTEVYNITWWDDAQEKVVVKGKTYYRAVRKHKVTKSTFSYFDIAEFGKTVFLTKSEAEAKLEELRGGEYD